MSEFTRSTCAFGERPSRRRAHHWLSGRLIFGLLLLAFGALWTLDNLDILEAERVTRYWPGLILAWGLCMLAGFQCRRRPVAGLAWTFIGGWLLLWELELVEYGIFDLWPVALIFVGGLLVLNAWRGRSFRSPAAEKEQQINVFVVMGGAERRVVTDAFRGGEISAVMGGVDLDLRGATLAPEGARMDVFAMFGGIDILVPEGWRVIGQVTPLLGGFEDHTVAPADPGAPTLTVRGMVVLGGVEVKHAGDAARAHRRARRYGPDPETQG